MPQSKFRHANSRNASRRRSGKTRNYRSKKERSQLQGRIEITRKGFAFVNTEEGSFFIPASEVQGAFPGDLVQIKRLRSTRNRRFYAGRYASHETSALRPEARVVSVVERASDVFIARIVECDTLCIAQIIDACVEHEIVLLNTAEFSIDEESLVRIKMVDFPTYYQLATAHILEVLASEYDAVHAMESLIRRAGFNVEFPAACIQEARSARIDIKKLQAQGYKDLRNRCLFTIDPQDARDFDDALSVLPHRDGTYTLGVHIADVAYFVRNNSSLDLEARERALSVYLPHKVIPMLPEELSGDLCSLKPHELRAAITVDIHLTSAAEVLDYAIYPSLICSSARMLYEEVQTLFNLLDEQSISLVDIGDSCKEKEIVSCIEKSGVSNRVIADSLLVLRDLTQKLFNIRKRKGALDFKTLEAKFRLTKDCLPIGLEFREKSEATQLVEEAMILANALVAHFLSEQNLPCIYRNHDEISPDNMERLLTILSYFPSCSTILAELSQNPKSLQDPFILQELLSAVASLPNERIITNLIITSLKRALYSQDLKGHFGLALKTYAHFTSPIRRYPDLIVHRMLHAHFLGQQISKSLQNQLSYIAEHSSTQERKIQKFSYDVHDYFMCLYMREFVGETFGVVISSCSERGCYIVFDNTAEAFVSYEALDLRFVQIDSSLCFAEGKEKKTNALRRYTIGEHILVHLDDVDIFAPRLICSRA